MRAHIHIQQNKAKQNPWCSIYRKGHVCLLSCSIFVSFCVRCWAGCKLKFCTFEMTTTMVMIIMIAIMMRDRDKDRQRQKDRDREKQVADQDGQTHGQIFVCNIYSTDKNKILKIKRWANKEHNTANLSSTAFTEMVIQYLTQKQNVPHHRSSDCGLQTKYINICQATLNL